MCASLTDVSLGLNIASETVRDSVRLAEYAEKNGFDHLWVAESQLVFRDPFIILAAMATKTSRLKLGTSVTNMVTRDWSVLAGAMASLNEFSDGRAELGLGRAYTAADTVGLRPNTLGELREGTERIRRLMSGEIVEYKGVRMKLFGNHRVPIYYGASARRSFELAGQVADGVFLHVGASPRNFEYAVGKVDEAARAAGRKVGDIEKGGFVILSISKDKKKSIDAAKYMCFNLIRMAHSTLTALPQSGVTSEIVLRVEEAALKNFSALTTDHNLIMKTVHDTITNEVAERLAVVGDADECAERLRELSRTGVNQLCINIQPQQERAQQLEIFAKQILPKL
jgi:5,10-methylenetetrahydromethanopterin reductase